MKVSLPTCFFAHVVEAKKKKKPRETKRAASAGPWKIERRAERNASKHSENMKRTHSISDRLKRT